VRACSPRMPRMFIVNTVEFGIAWRMRTFQNRGFLQRYLADEIRCFISNRLTRLSYFTENAMKTPRKINGKLTRYERKREIHIGRNCWPSAISGYYLFSVDKRHTSSVGMYNFHFLSVLLSAALDGSTMYLYVNTSQQWLMFWFWNIIYLMKIYKLLTVWNVDKKWNESIIISFSIYKLLYRDD